MRDEGASGGISSLDPVYGSRPDRHKATGDECSPGASSWPGQPDPARPSARSIRDFSGDLGICAADAALAEAAALRNETDVGRELVASGCVLDEDLAEALARTLGLPVERPAAGDQIIEGRSAAPGMPMIHRTCGAGLKPKIFLAPKLDELPLLQRLLGARPDIRNKARVTTRRDIRAHLAEASVQHRSQMAQLSLAATHPEQSARHVLSGRQGAVLATLVLCLAFAAVAQPALCLLVLHMAAGILFTAAVLLRLAAARALLASSRPYHEHPPDDPAGALVHPVYTVMVALHRESDVVADLVGALARLEWPRSKLEVMLVCEGDDPDTIVAARIAARSEPGFEVVVVPPSLPRTKPKALNFALPLATGEFLVLYDAEDRPAPGQLQEAWSAFRSGDARLACVQAPLVIDNGADHWFAGLFALEYAALFRGLLPWLARHRLPLPLGGTSNHFRRAVLVDVGAWDSHNVTEDADLGIRLFRKGYLVGTLRSPTLEAAPVRWRVWRNQRTRWMKGWMQTWCVHMREPLQLARDLGPRGFAAFQILFFGMIVSSFAHPLFIGFLGIGFWHFATGAVPDDWAGLLLALDVFNVVGGYTAFIVLALGGLTSAERRTLPRRLWWLPAYWLLISLAALRAFGQLWTKPHHWEKTPHGPSAQRASAEARAQPAPSIHPQESVKP